MILVGAVIVLSYLAIALLLVREYLRTRNVGVIWLAAAVIVWPFVSRLLVEPIVKVFISRITHGQSVVYPFTLVEHGQMTLGALTAWLSLTQQVIGVGLLLVAVLYLARTKTKHDHEPA